jgi:hypothetical protein
LEALSGGNVIASRTLHADDLPTTEVYQRFDIEFGSDRPLPAMTLRVHYDGSNEVWADAAELSYIYRAPSQ